MGRLGVRIVVTALVFASGLATLPVASAQAQGNPFVTTSVPRNPFALTGTPNPFVTTGAPSSVTQTTATFNGTVNPNDDYLVSCVFDYGTTTDYEIGQVPCTSIPSGGSPVAVSANVSGLSPNTAYHYQLVVSDDYTSHPGGDQPFSTLPNTPTVSTTNATGVSGTTATLNGSVNPNGGAITNCHFDYGLSTSYGSSVPCAQAVGSGATPVAVTAFLSGLTPNTTYHFRVVASNASGPSYGADQTFTTLPNGPAVVTGSASGVSESGATLNGTVNPRGGNIIDCHFDWGTSTAYGQSVPCAQTVGSGTSPVAVSAVLSGLTNHTVYHFRVVATNVGGTGDGADQTFTTGSVPSVSVSAPVVKATGAAFSGTVNPEGLATTVQFEYGLHP